MIFVKEVAIADVEAIRHIAGLTWWDTYSTILSKEQIGYMFRVIYSAETIAAQIESASQTYLLLLEDSQPVALAGYSIREEDPEIYKLHKLYCIPAAQGKGYGKILLDAVIENILLAGKHILELNVNRYNKAKNFYEKFGFKAIYEEDVPIGDYWMNDYVMRKELQYSI